jgi:hypothetical protein
VRIFERLASARRTGAEGGPRPALEAPPRSRRGTILGLGFLVLAITVALGVSIASAAPPTVTLSSIDNATYTSAEIHGSIDPNGEPISWFPELSTDGVNWGGAPGGGFFEGSELSGPQEINEPIGGLTAGQTYFFRIVATNVNTGEEVRSAALETTTRSIAAPTVTIDPITTHTGTTAELSGHIDPNAPSGALSPEEEAAYGVAWHFECSPECPGLEGGTVEAGAEGEDQIVKTEATGLEPNKAYTVTLVGKNAGPAESDGPVEFTTDAVEPEVQTLPAFAIRGGTEALVGGQVNPRNSDTTYWIEYGPTTGHGQKFPAAPVDAGSGGAPVFVTQRLAGLAPSTVYHFKLVAESNGVAEGGVDQNFETAPSGEAVEQGCPNATLRIENNSTALPRCRAYEQVSPVDKNGFDVGVLPETRERTFVAAEDGSKVSFEVSGGFGDSKSVFLFNPYLSTRGPSGWNTHALAPAGHSHTEASSQLTRVGLFSPDLQSAAINPPPGHSYAPGDFAGNRNLYLLNTETELLTTLSHSSSPITEEFPTLSGVSVLGASRDFKRIFFESRLPLVEGAAPPLINGADSIGVPSLYEWSDGQVHLVSVLPDGKPSQSAALTSGVSGSTYVSEDGSRFMFGTEGGSYLWEDGQTYLISGAPSSQLAGATPDLSSIFFISQAALTADAANDGHFKLYRFNSGPKTISLISPNATDGGEVVDVRGVSPDGSYIYFRSHAQYIPGQGVSPGGNPGTANLYLWHDGEITFIAAEHPEGEAGNGSKFRVSPDGTMVSFQSSDRLTAYDNTDATPGPGGEPRADSEIYVYDATAKRLSCVSCNPDGESPSGTPGGPDAGSTFPAKPFRQENLQPGVGDDGHIFFTSRDALVPADVNGVEDVYEWRDGQPHLISTGTGAEPAYLASTSPSGDDVFFTTRQQLVRSDRDFLGDLYDARVDGGFAASTEASLCEGLDSCHGAESRPPGEAGLGTPNTTPELKADTARLRLKKAIKACKREPHKKRAKCRAAAKKKFKKASTGKAH